MDDQATICTMCQKPLAADQTPDLDKNQGHKTAVQAKTNQLLAIVQSLGRSRQFWLTAFYILSGALTLFWGTKAVMKFFEPEAVKSSTMQVEPAVASQFETMIKELLPEKLDWAREQMKRRLPSRFPEELLMETDETKVEVNYDNKKHTAAHYEMQIAYHLKEIRKESYIWQPVTFYFELRQGKWVMVGDKWIRDSDLVFE